MEQHYFKAQINLGEKYRKDDKRQQAALKNALQPLQKYAQMEMCGWKLMKNDQTEELVVNIFGRSPSRVESDFMYQFFITSLQPEFENMRVLEKTTGYGEISVDAEKEEAPEEEEKPKEQEEQEEKPKQ